MGIHNLFGFCLAVFSVSALAADPPVPRSNVSVTVNPTTGYYSSTNSTVRLPSGVSVSPTTGLPVVSKYSGGMQQTIPTGITIDAIKKSAPLPAVVRATTQSVKGAATRCLTSARCNVALMLAGAGLDKLLNDLDWVMGDGGKVQKVSPLTAQDYLDFVEGVPTSSSCSNCTYDTISTSGTIQTYPSNLASHLGSDRFPVEVRTGYGNNKDQIQVEACFYFYRSSPFSYYSTSGFCKYAKRGNDTAILPPLPSPSLSPASDSDIESGVNSNYEPEPSDWPALTSELILDDVEITSAPTLSSNPKIKTIYDAAGNPVEVQETKIGYDFDIRNNPSPSPSLDLKTRQETKTYKNGALTGTTTTTDTDSAGTVAGGGGSSVDTDIPTDCEFMPTVCAFLEWFKTDDTPEDPDLSALIDNRDFTETYSITGGSKQCPADYEFTVDFIGRTYGLSFEPACDFASKMYYFVMAAAYIFAAYITIGASRNG